MGATLIFHFKYYLACKLELWVYEWLGTKLTQKRSSHCLNNVVNIRLILKST